MAATALKDVTAGIGTISYGHIIFGPLRKSEIVGEAVYDDANRTVKYIRYTLTIHGFIYASSVAAMNGRMDALHNELLEPGNKLVIKDVGFDLGIDTSGKTPDLCWGAKPRILHWATIGYVGAEVVWVVEFCVSRCAQGSAITAGPMTMFNYGATYSNDAEGLQTRTVRGSLEIPGIRGTGGLLALNVDDKWDKIICRVPNGFRRMNNTREINPAKDRIDFSFTDTQLPGQAYPAGIVDADLNYQFQNINNLGFLQWAATLSGSLTVAPNQAPALAGQVFFSILAAKVAQLKQTANQGSVIPWRCMVGHKLFSRTSSFSVTFAVATCLEEILSASGIWTPVANADYGTWAASMKNIWDNRGLAGLVFNSADDKIVDACVSFPSASIGNDQARKNLVQGNFSKTLFCDVDQKNSYLQYSNDVQGVAEHQTVIHRFAQIFNPHSITSNHEPHVVQYQGSPDVYAIMTGYARRLKFKPEPPQLLSIGGIPVDLVQEIVKVPADPESRLFDCPIYFGQWTRLYILKTYPGNPALTFKGTKHPSSCPTG